MQRIILHIDMNAYFASCAVLAHPEYKGKPLAVGGQSSRSIISTASYEAREFGIHSAMPTYQARRLCPNLIIVSPDFTLYEYYTRQFVRIIRNYSSIIEMASIDECYVDMTERLKGKKNPLEIIKSIQTRILEELGLSCSIGVAPNKFLAKMASDMKKPLGITVIRKKEVPVMIWPLPIGDMFGIGKKGAIRLKEMGINKIGDLLTYADQLQLKKALGKGYDYFISRAQGIDYTPVSVETDDAKSVGHSRTFDHDTEDYTEMENMIWELSEMVSYRAKREHLIGDTIAISIKYSDFLVNNRARKVQETTSDKDIIFTAAMKLFDDNYANKPVRLLGVTLQKTIKEEDYVKQLNLFEPEAKPLPISTQQEIRKIIQQINRQLGKDSLKLACEVKQK